MSVAPNYFSHILSVKGIAPRLVWLVTLAVAAALLEGVGMGFLIPIVEGLQHQQSGKPPTEGMSSMVTALLGLLGLPSTLPFILGVGLAMFVSQAVLVYLRSLLAFHTQNKLVAQLRTQAFTNLMQFDLGFFHRSRIGELVNTVITEANRAGYALRAMVEMFAIGCLLVVYAAVEVVISWQLAILAFPLLGMVAILFRPRCSYELGVKQSTENDRLQSIAVECLSGIREIKTLGIGDMAADRFQKSVLALAHADVTNNENGARFALIYQAVVVTVVVGLVYVASQAAGLSLAPLLVFLVVLQRMAPRVGGFTEQRHWWLGWANAAEKVDALIKDTSQEKMVVRNGRVPFHQLERGIEIKNVCFRHEGQTSETLSNVSFPILRGKTVAIVGASGAGKSTLLDLLLRFHDPTSGCIFVDQCDLRDLDLHLWRRALGVVGQDSFLFNDTVQNNIRFGNPNASHDEIVQAAQQAYAHHFISEMPDGYATVIGDRGVKLSGGQRQRVALARAMVRQPQLLILDEATSDLDSESEAYIQQAIKEVSGSRTVVIVAHRLSTVEHADLILVLEKGVVVESGQHAELRARGGRFAEFYQYQFKDS